MLVLTECQGTDWYCINSLYPYNSSVFTATTLNFMLDLSVLKISVLCNIFHKFIPIYFPISCFSQHSYSAKLKPQNEMKMLRKPLTSFIYFFSFTAVLLIFTFAIR